LSVVADRVPIVVLISGRGTNMRALVERSADPSMGCRVAAVISDQPEAAGLAAAAALGVPARALPAPGRGATAAARIAYDAALAAVIEEYSPSLVVLAGFMRILSPQFVARFPGRALNIHPSLLPKYPGLDTHQRALEAHDAEHGATVHFVTAELDGGPPVIQGRLAVAPGEDAEHLAARVHRLEHRIYPLAVRWFCTGRLRCAEGRAWLDGEVLSHPVIYDDDENRRGSGSR
jgi:phosphoribosylglycinamide formyltransferase-1